MKKIMGWRPRWTTVVLALGLVAAITVASPGFGISLRKLVKKEVAKQISKATGPAGAPGAPGATGAPGAPGTARAYGRVNSQSNSACAPNCQLTHSKGISNVTRSGVGDYCVQAPGIDAHEVSAVASVDWGNTAGPEGNATAMVYTTCSGNGFEVLTERLPTTGTIAADEADDVGFTIVIP
jgi:hypothetical protein